MSIEAFLAEHVVFTTAAAVLMHQLGVPVPSMPPLIWAGARMLDEPVLALSAFLLAMIAGVAGDLPWYWAGRRYGYRILRLVCRITLSADSCVRQSASAFERRGPAILVTARFLPGLGTVAAPLAGALNLPPKTFLLYDTAGSALKTAAGLAIGFAFHDQIDSLLDRLALLGTNALIVFGLLIAGYIAYRFVERQRFLRSLQTARVNVQELYEMIRRGDEPVVLDVRNEAHRRQDGRRIPGARAVDFADIDRSAAAIPRDREVIVYCACPNEASAAIVALRLREHGFRRVRPLAGGIDAWVSAGFAIEGRASDDEQPVAIHPLPAEAR